MWFKQLSIYPVTIEQLPDLDHLQSQLEQTAFTPCSGLDWDSTGFTQPVPFNDDMVFAAQGIWRLALKKEDKVLPAAVVRDILDEKLNEIKELEGRVVGRKEKTELKENITDDLLPRAFTKSSKTEALLDSQRGLLLINQANTNRSELFLTKLREALGGLEARLPHTQQSPGSLMTEWLLRGQAAGQFELDSDCELKGLGDTASVVRISHQDLTAEEVVSHVKNGKIVTQLGLCWQDRLRFVLTQDMTFKRIQFLDIVQEEAAAQGEDLESLMFASQLLMAEALGDMLNELVAHLGGWSAQP